MTCTPWASWAISSGETSFTPASEPFMAPAVDALERRWWPLTAADMGRGRLGRRRRRRRRRRRARIGKSKVQLLPVFFFFSFFSLSFSLSFCSLLVLVLFLVLFLFSSYSSSSPPSYSSSSPSRSCSSSSISCLVLSLSRRGGGCWGKEWWWKGPSSARRQKSRQDWQEANSGRQSQQDRLRAVQSYSCPLLQFQSDCLAVNTQVIRCRCWCCRRNSALVAVWIGCDDGGGGGGGGGGGHSLSSEPFTV